MGSFLYIVSSPLPLKVPFSLAHAPLPPSSSLPLPHHYDYVASIFSIATVIEEGAIGNFVRFKNCVFEENMATEYGGAVGLILPSANIIFDNRDNIRPITFDSW